MSLDAAKKFGPLFEMHSVAENLELLGEFAEGETAKVFYEAAYLLQSHCARELDPCFHEPKMEMIRGAAKLAFENLKNDKDAERFLTEGLAIEPSDPELLQLKQQLDALTGEELRSRKNSPEKLRGDFLRTAHMQAMEFCFLIDHCGEHYDEETRKRMAECAFTLERAVAILSPNHHPTKEVLCRSAAAIAICRAKMFLEGLKMVELGLANCEYAEIQEQLKNLEKEGLEGLNALVWSS